MSRKIACTSLLAGNFWLAHVLLLFARLYPWEERRAAHSLGLLDNKNTRQSLYELLCGQKEGKRVEVM